MTANVSKYTNLITSEHADKQNFVATIAASTQPLVDLINFYQSMQNGFDIDNAAGDQLDKIGQWVGISRYLNVPISAQPFTLDSGPGLDSGYLWDGVSSLTSISTLDDVHYKILLKVKILDNHWDGTNQHFQDLSVALFPISNCTLFIKDTANLSVQLGFVESVVSSVALGLLQGSYLDLKPATVTVTLPYLHPYS